MTTKKNAVSVKTTGSDGKEKTVEFAYDQEKAETIQDAESLVSKFFDKVKNGSVTALAQVLDCFNYGYDLKVKSDVRQRAVATLGGPDAALEKARKSLVAAFMAMGLTEEAATAKASADMQNIKASVSQ